MPIGSTSGSAPTGPASNNTIGGIAAGTANVIANNGRNGVRIANNSSTGNAILSNSIYTNTNIGIDLNGDGITANGTNPRTFPNNGQNYPVLTSYSSAGGSTTIPGTLTSATNTAFTIQFFSNTTCVREGRTFLGQTTAVTNGSGSASFNAVVTASVAQGSAVTATATDAAGNTSEFSDCAPQAPAITDGALSGSSQVSGTAQPNGTNCITIFDCGIDARCGTGDDIPLGTGSTTGTGAFTITVVPPLTSGHTIFAKDTCHNLAGPATSVTYRTPAPALSPAAFAVTAAVLALLGARHVRRRVGG